MKNLILTTIISIIGLGTIAQQEYSFTNYFEANSFYNPAATGTEGTQNITALFRKQWAGFEGSPLTGGILYENSLKELNMGLGGYVFMDQIGATTMNSLAVNYSYSLKLNENHKLAFGIDAGADIYTTDYSRLTYWDGDVMFDDQKRTVALPRLGVGVHYYTEKYHVGISVPRILSFNNESPMGISSQDLSSTVSNYYLNAGYTFELNKDFDLQANVLGKYTQRVSPQGDINVMTTYKKIIGLGLGYKSLGFASVYLQYSYEDVVTIGYAFDFTLSNVAKYSNGSHEVMIKYAIPSKKKNRASMN